MSRLGEELASRGLSRVLVVTDGGIREVGLLEPVEAALGEAGVKAAVFDGVKGNPLEAQVVGGARSLPGGRCRRARGGGRRLVDGRGQGGGSEGASPPAAGRLRRRHRRRPLRHRGGTADRSDSHHRRNRQRGGPLRRGHPRGHRPQDGDLLAQAVAGARHPRSGDDPRTAPAHHRRHRLRRPHPLGRGLRGQGPSSDVRLHRPRRHRAVCALARCARPDRATISTPVATC